jgi:hypothetical protein
VNGCCYGKRSRKSEQQGDYVKLCGQRFWEFISGDPELYLKIIEPIGHRARERNIEFELQYELVVDAFTELFRSRFCDTENRIMWEELTKTASAPPVPRQQTNSN